LPLREAKAARELAKVLTRMPNHATAYEPAMPTRLKMRMSSTLPIDMPDPPSGLGISQPKYQPTATAMKAQRTSRNLPCWIMYDLQVA